MLRATCICEASNTWKLAKDLLFLCRLKSKYMSKDSIMEKTTNVDFEAFKTQVLDDFRLASLSREASLLGRREVLTGKAKFGIFGDGKELAQIALAKQFRDGDFRSGYYRDQTIMMAIEQLNVQQYLFKKFTNGGNEVAFGTIGDASTSEGPFWETINAAGVLQVPMVMSVWDDGYGISVPREHQTTKDSISEALAGMQRTKDKPGYEIFVTKGWDYAHLCETYEKAVKLAREEHVPVLVHVKEVNQPQGHSTSGSHERYKSEERLQWEVEFDCVNKFKEWIVNFDADGHTIATSEELDAIQKETKKEVRDAKNAAWKAFTDVLKVDKTEAVALIKALGSESSNGAFIGKLAEDLENAMDPIRKDILSAARKALRLARGENGAARQALSTWIRQQVSLNFDRYSSHLHSESANSALNIAPVAPTYDGSGDMEDGRIILRDNYDQILANYPEALVFGEDAGKIGGVNQTLEGMQDKYGELRVADTGIREATIIGQGIGMAMRGLRPIAEIQYLDYLLYGIQVLSDDLSTVQYRTKGGQKAPLIVSTRGHRLEGIWHSGSPMGMIINALRGMYICVPRNMTKAAGFYNTLFLDSSSFRTFQLNQAK